MSWKKGKSDGLTGEQAEVLGRWQYNSATDELTTDSTVKANLNSFILGENGHGIHSAGEQLVVQNRRSSKNYVPVWTEVPAPSSGDGPYNVVNRTYGRDYSGSAIVVWGSITPAYATPATTNVQDFQVYLDSASNNATATDMTVYRIKVAVRESGATDVAVNFPVEYVVYAGGSYDQQVVREVFNCQRSNTTQIFSFKAPFDLKRNTNTRAEMWVLNSKFERVRLLKVLAGTAPNGRRWVDCQIQYSAWTDRAMAYDYEGKGSSLAFALKDTDGGTIEQNGFYLLNDYDAASMRVTTVNPRVDYLKIASWDNSQSQTRYAELKLPLNTAGSSHVIVRYKTNNPVELFRDRTTYTWRLRYEGYTFVAGLSNTPDTVHDIGAGREYITGSLPIFQGNTTTTGSIDHILKLKMVTSNTGATMNAYLQVGAGVTLSAVHTYFNQNVTAPAHAIGTISNSSTIFVVDGTSTDGEVAYIDIVIHSSSDGKNDWKYKYKGRFTHHTDNNYYFALEREINPRYTY